jgi:amino acid transporter
MQTGPDEFVEAPGEIYVAETDLKKGAIGLTGAIMQNVTHIAPAVAAFLFTPTLVGFAGSQAPLAYLIGFVIVLALGVTLVQLATRFPSAGGYFTYVSRTVGPRPGFLVGWLFSFYSPVVTGPFLAFLGLILEGEFASNFDIHWFHWWMLVIVGAPLIAMFGYLGVAISMKAIVIVGAFEFLVVLSLGLFGLFNPGPGGFTFATFNGGFDPSGLLTGSGFALAVVFTVQGLTGWEAAVPLAEETENPRRNVPIAIIASIVIIGIMLVVTIWGQVIGWGTSNLAKLPGSSELPALVIAHRVWGHFWVLALIAIVTSVIGGSLAFQNVSTRMWFGMGRAGVLPSALGRVHPVRKTPTAAVTAHFVLSLVLGLGGGLIFGPEKLFILVIGYVLVIAVILIYVMANIGVVLYYWREQRSHFNWILHFAFPVGTSLILLYSLYKSFDPIPAAPYGFAPVIVIVWLALGIGILVIFKARGNTAWMELAAASAQERPETEEELQHRPIV